MVRHLNSIIFYITDRSAEVEVEDGTKIPDAALVSDDISRQSPLAAVEVGFTETLDKLFNDAERLLRSSCDLVILLKVFETEPHRKDEFPWGIEPSTVANLRKLHHQKKLAPAILDYYDANGLPLLGNLDVHLYICPKGQKRRPTKPSYRLKQTGIKQLRVRIQGRLFNLPIESLEDALEKATRVERNRRIYKLIRKASIS